MQLSSSVAKKRLFFYVELSLAYFLPYLPSHCFLSSLIRDGPSSRLSTRRTDSTLFSSKRETAHLKVALFSSCRNYPLLRLPKPKLAIYCNSFPFLFIFLLKLHLHRGVWSPNSSRVSPNSTRQHAHAQIYS